MPEHYFGIIALGRDLLRYGVALSAVFSSLFIVIAVWNGFKYKTYGLTVIALVTFLAQWIVSLAGPFSSYKYLWPHNPTSNFIQFGIPTLLGLIIFWQFLRYAPIRHPLLPGVKDRYHLAAWAGFVVSAAGCWTFIVYHQDYFVNEVQPTQNLVASVSLLAAVFLRPDIRGLSVVGAWCYLIGNAMLYTGMWAGEMSDPFPMAEHGYYYIYWLWWMIFLSNLAYAILLRRRKRSGAVQYLPALERDTQ